MSASSLAQDLECPCQLLVCQLSDTGDALQPRRAIWQLADVLRNQVVLDRPPTIPLRALQRFRQLCQPLGGGLVQSLCPHVGVSNQARKRGEGGRTSRPRLVLVVEHLLLCAHGNLVLLRQLLCELVQPDDERRVRRVPVSVLSAPRPSAQKERGTDSSREEVDGFTRR